MSKSVTMSKSHPSHTHSCHLSLKLPVSEETVCVCCGGVLFLCTCSQDPWSRC